MESKNLIIDERIRQIEKNKLSELGYKLIEVKKCEYIYPEIASHTDIFVCKIGEKIIIEPNQYEYIKHQLQYKNLKNHNKILQGNQIIGEKYPLDIKYNVCTIGKMALHNFDYTDDIIKKELIDQNYEMINTKQGYTNCSIAVIDNNSAIVTDKGLCKILQKHNVNTLYLEYEPNIKLLTKNNEYSEKKGFIGGAISRVGKYIVVFGDLNKIDINMQIRNFIEKRKIEIIEFAGLDVIDYGGLIEYKEME